MLHRTLGRCALNTPIYPLYLDVPMMLSFLATLEGGISFSSTVSQRKISKEGSAKEAEAGGSVPAVLSLFSLNAKGRISAVAGVDNSEEEEYVLQHTEASLFNRLYELLQGEDESNPGRLLDLNDPEAELIPDLHFGTIAQIRGTLSPNPLNQILGLYDVYGAFIKSSLISGQQPGNRRRSNQGTGGKQPAADPATDAIMSLIRDGMSQSGLTDVLLTAIEGCSIKNAVVTLKNDNSSTSENASVIESAMGGYCTVIGKLTQISLDSDISLLRRSIIGMMPEPQVSSMFQAFRSIKDIEIEINDHIVAAPMVQILPLAIFV